MAKTKELDDAVRPLPEQVKPIAEQVILNLALGGILKGHSARVVIARRDDINKQYDDWVNSVLAYQEEL